MTYRSLPQTDFPVWVWGEIDEPQAARQVRNIATLPTLFHHIAVMPDVHFGIGATVGTVIASDRAVIPAAVGVDIGCGMAAVRLPLERAQLESGGRLGALRQSIERAIPLGFHQHRPERVSARARAWAAERLAPRKLRAPLPRAVLDKALLQIGTLGGGNHFIEICADERGRGWVLLHSGSRHIGKQLADWHIKAAKALLTRKNRLKDLPDANLAYFERGEPEFEDYLADLFWAQAYARFNRDEMMRRILAQIARHYGRELGLPAHPGVHPAGPSEFDEFNHINEIHGSAADKRSKDDAVVAEWVRERVDCHHNYVARERHFGREVYVTRKGAVSAKAGELGIIPGSMGVRSYIVRGKGNPDSFHSCAHGAGRAMSRTEAKRRFTVHDLKYQTQGVDCRKDKGVLDEIPQAYKDIGRVMAAQEDLVEVVHTLKQLVCVKG